jgi:hypothetical protein
MNARPKEPPHVVLEFSREEAAALLTALAADGEVHAAWRGGGQ